MLVTVGHHRLQDGGRRRRALLLRDRVAVFAGGIHVVRVHVHVTLRLVGGGQKFCEEFFLLVFISIV